MFELSFDNPLGLNDRLSDMPEGVLVAPVESGLVLLAGEGGLDVLYAGVELLVESPVLPLDCAYANPIALTIAAVATVDARNFDAFMMCS